MPKGSVKLQREVPRSARHRPQALRQRFGAWFALVSSAAAGFLSASFSISPDGHAEETDADQCNRGRLGDGLTFRLSQPAISPAPPPAKNRTDVGKGRVDPVAPPNINQPTGLKVLVLPPPVRSVSDTDRTRLLVKSTVKLSRYQLFNSRLFQAAPDSRWVEQPLTHRKCYSQRSNSLP